MCLTMALNGCRIVSTRSGKFTFAFLIESIPMFEWPKSNLLLFRSSDQPTCMTDGYIKSVIDLQQIQQHVSQKINCLDCSSVTGEGFREVVTWIQNNCVS